MPAERRCRTGELMSTTSARSSDASTWSPGERAVEAGGRSIGVARRWGVLPAVSRDPAVLISYGRGGSARSASSRCEPAPRRTRLRCGRWLAPGLMALSALSPRRVASSLSNSVTARPFPLSQLTSNSIFAPSSPGGVSPDSTRTGLIASSTLAERFQMSLSRVDMFSVSVGSAEAGLRRRDHWSGRRCKLAVGKLLWP